MSQTRRIPALDGLRGLAVVAVVIYHAWPEVLPGGWIGVSVFFTLSGYLISGIVVREHELTGRSMAAFWRRRARRLLPAALATTVATVVAVGLIDSDALAGTAREGAAATAYVHNWWSAATTGGYWEIFDSTPRPLAHMWSLSIEEQVYLLWPLLLVALGLRRALGAGTVVVVIGVAVWWGSADAYYATPFRFAEVLAGALVAAVVIERPAFKIGGAPAAIAGLGLLAATATLSESDPIVAKGALLVVALAAAVVVGWARTSPVADRFLGDRVLRWLGTRSYAIYLFHWPVLVLLAAPPVVAIVVTLVLAEISGRLLEGPVRSGRLVARPLGVLGSVSAVAAVALLAVAAAAPGEVSDDQVAAAMAAQLATTTTTTTAVATTTTAALSPTAVDETTTTTTTEPPPTPYQLPADPIALLVGDSTGYVVEPAFKAWIEASGGSALPGANVSCSPLFSATEHDYWSTSGFGPFETPCRPEIVEGIDLVVLIDHGVVFMDHHNGHTDTWTDISQPDMYDAVSAEYQLLVAQTAAVGAHLILTTPPTPVIPEMLDERAESGDRRMAAYRQILLDTAASGEHVELVDIGPIIQANPDRYPRTDGLHLDPDTGAVNMIVDLLGPLVAFAPAE